jgi:hypothetical protein
MIGGRPGLRTELRDGRWQLADAADGDLINHYLSYLADRGFSAHTVRAYAFDLLAFARWLDGEQLPLAAVTTDVLLLPAAGRPLSAGPAGNPAERDAAPPVWELGVATWVLTGRLGRSGYCRGRARPSEAGSAPCSTSLRPPGRHTRTTSRSPVTVPQHNWRTQVMYVVQVAQVPSGPNFVDKPRPIEA